MFNIGDKVRLTKTGLKSLYTYDADLRDNPRKIYVVTASDRDGQTNPCINFGGTKQWGVYGHNIEHIMKTLILIRRK